MSLVIYDKNLTKIEEADYLVPIYIAGANIDRSECKYINQNNYSSCGVPVKPDFLQPIVNHKRIKYVSFATITDKLK